MKTGEHCPNCGRFLPHVNQVHDRTRLSNTEYKIWIAVSHRTARVTTDDLVELLYADREDAGPNDPKSVIYLTIHRMNKKLKFINKKILWRQGSYSCEDA